MNSFDSYKSFYCLISGDEHRCKRILIALSHIDSAPEFWDLKQDKSFCDARRVYMEAIEAAINANYHAMPNPFPKIKQGVWDAIDALRVLIKEYIERDGFVSSNLAVPHLII